MADKIKDLRSDLDGVDQDLVDALTRRDEIVRRIAAVKADSEGGIRDAAREETVLGKVAALAREQGLSADYVTALYREILDHSVRRQQHHLAEDAADQDGKAPVLVGFQGTDGSYSHMATGRHFAAMDREITSRGYNTFKQVVEAVQSGAVDYGVLPVENTTAGSINETYDLLARTDLAQVGEEIYRINHCVLAVEKVPLSHIRRIFSQAQALAQCTEFLDSLKNCQVVSFTDTAMACQKILADQDLSQASIASEDAGRIYGLHVIKRGVANQKENFTRFAVVGREAVAYDARIPCKTSLVFATRHEEGALLKCMRVMAQHHLNLTKLESRPRPGVPWEYLFYVDFEGNLGDPAVQEGLKALKAHTGYLKVLGSYPARMLPGQRPAEPKAEPQPAEMIELGDLDPPVSSGLNDEIRAILEQKPYKLASRASREEDTVIRVGNVLIGGDKPILMAGPCSVESADQIMACAQAVKDAGGHVLRGGCFKPRTSPYAFQGLGYEGLNLLEEAGQKVGLPIITEVLHPSDVAAVARQVDILQVGARNMQNFALLKEVGKVDCPVMLKRGMMASVDEWLAAAEYILAQGNQQVILCERGIRTFETATRNTLDLTILPVVRERTHLPILVDPSHACGVRRWIMPLVEASLACGAHGVMVEIHPKPEDALSDGPQALTFDMWASMMTRFRQRYAG